MGWTVVTTSVLWLTLMRALLVPSRRWSLFGLDGTGLAGDLWIVALLAGFSALMLALGWRGKQAPFHLMLLLWHGTISSVAITVAIRQTIDRGTAPTTPLLSLAVLASALLAFAVLAAVWVALDIKRSRARAATVQPLFQLPVQELLVAAALLPAAFLLYRVGGGGTLGNSLGNLALLLQWVLLAGVVMRGRAVSSRRESEPLAGLDTGEHSVASSSRLRSR